MTNFNNFRKLLLPLKKVLCACDVTIATAQNCLHFETISFCST